MARDWRRRALAAVAAAVLGSLSALGAHAQAAKKKAKAPPPEAEQQSEDKAEAQPKAPAAKKKQDPVEAQRAIEAAAKLLQAGKADQAAQSLTATLSGGNLPPALMAKALYTRGIANRQLKRPAQAISDLTSALWLKGGLAEADRADAMQQRAAAYRDAGLGDGGEAVAAAPPVAPAAPAPSIAHAAPAPAAPVASSPAPSAASSPATPKAQRTAGWGPPPSEDALAEQRQRAPAPAAKSSWNILDPFGLFSAPAKQTTTGSIARSEAPAAPPPPAQPQASAWSSATQVSSAPEPAGARAAPAPAPTPAPGKLKGKFRVQVASVRTQAEALSIAAKAKRDHADVLAARETEVDEAVVGNMGSFYRVRIGPFATLQETQSVCAKLRGSGLDCHTVTQ